MEVVAAPEIQTLTKTVLKAYVAVISALRTEELVGIPGKL